MKDQYLSEIIEHLEQNTSKEDGYFEFGDEDEGYVVYIKGNSEGLKIFATELLKAAVEIEKGEPVPKEIKLNINDNEEWYEGLPVEYVAPSNKDKTLINNQESIGDKFAKYGFFAILILILISIVVGFITIGNWIF